MIVRLSYSGHYPSRRVEVTDEEYQQLVRLDDRFLISDSEEGQELIKKLVERPDIPEPVFTIYQ